VHRGRYAQTGRQAERGISAGSPNCLAEGPSTRAACDNPRGAAPPRPSAWAAPALPAPSIESGVRRGGLPLRYDRA
jgi:hypothetical protein